VKLQVVWQRDFSGAADGAAMFLAILICAAACGSGSSSTEHCRWCSGDSCRWCSRLHLVELQVVWQRDFSGAADGAAMISAILICAAACGSGSSSTGHCGGAVRQLQVAQQVNPVGLQV
jgi:hypothetical protein